MYDFKMPDKERENFLDLTPGLPKVRVEKGQLAFSRFLILNIRISEDVNFSALFDVRLAQL